MKYNVDDLELLPRYTAVGMQTRGHSMKLKKRSCNGQRGANFLVLEWSMDGIGCQKVLLPQHQSTVSKDVMIDLFASHQKMTILEPLKKRVIHGHNCLQRSVSDDDDDDDDVPWVVCRRNTTCRRLG